ncbi:MAG: hypothetical protein KIT16_00330 [Rhodospirillaceae bacterium]|nr:hypothetical protein [Rhodospirillaceae bacterium]
MHIHPMADEGFVREARLAHQHHQPLQHSGASGPRRQFVGNRRLVEHDMGHGADGLLRECLLRRAALKTRQGRIGLEPPFLRRIHLDGERRRAGRGGRRRLNHVAHAAGDPVAAAAGIGRARPRVEKRVLAERVGFAQQGEGLDHPVFFLSCRYRVRGGRVGGCSQGGISFNRRSRLGAPEERTFRYRA